MACCKLSSPRRTRMSLNHSLIRSHQPSLRKRNGAKANQETRQFTMFQHTRGNTVLTVPRAPPTSLDIHKPLPVAHAPAW